MTEKEREKQRAYRKANADKVKAARKIYLDANKEKITEQKKLWRKANPDKVKAMNKANNNKHRDKINKYQNNKYKVNPIFRIRKNMSNTINKCLTRNGFGKSSNTEQILGCTFEEFKAYLESKFEPWMNWDNKGLYNGIENFGWDIDHIIPQSVGITENEILQLNHYTNLQPLCSYINRDIKRAII